MRAFKVASLYDSVLEHASHNCIPALISLMIVLFTVSPERFGQSYGIEHREVVFTSGMQHSYRPTEIPLSSFTQHLRTGKYSPQCLHKPF